MRRPPGSGGRRLQTICIFSLDSASASPVYSECNKGVVAYGAAVRGMIRHLAPFGAGSCLKENETFAAQAVKVFFYTQNKTVIWSRKGCIFCEVLLQ